MAGDVVEHLVSRVGLPDDPLLRRHHLRGLTSGLQGWTDPDVEAARPALDPWRHEFDKGRAAGLNMARRNPARRKALQGGTPGATHRIEQAQAELDARRLPELP